ncbi:MAG: glycosyltransferase family 4 protein [Bacteroides sp.]|nr:glycosyltransferase family 4 protein [Alistipes timonensis]MCM1311174.1 glycosyltransferase family 4 protein [Bacteroides sp.]MCM1405571.1 glycosyltransferase family 4 protein [[Clostridium] fimetarium]
MIKDINKEKIILYAGTVNERKGYADLIKAFAKIAKRFPGWSVVFAGNGEIEEGVSLSKRLGVEKQIKFAGWVSGEQKDSLFRKASIFCLPSYAEGFPMAVLDAWAYGLPVITTPVGGIPDVAIDGENMLIFSPGDTDKLSEHIEKLITNETLRRKISNASMDFARNKFNIATVNKQLGDIYSSLSTD